MSFRSGNVLLNIRKIMTY